MPTAEIIAIGTELLLGEIQDTNTQFLARQLRDIGIDLYRSTQIGDNTERIATVIQEAMNRSEIIITTGGLGPTVDDPTREAVARALGVQTVYHPELWGQILKRYQCYSRQPTENNRRQAYLPMNATAIENPVGTAPAFRVETGKNVIISIPGVPREMEYLTLNAMLPFLQERFNLKGKIIKARVLHTAGAGESQIDEMIGDLETHVNPTVGLLAKPGQTDVRITAKAETETQANQMLDDMAAIVSQRLGNLIYGTDSETLEMALSKLLKSFGWHLVCVESGLKEELSIRLANALIPLNQIINLPNPCDLQQLIEKLRDLKSETNAEAGLAARICVQDNKNTLSLHLETPQGIYSEIHTFGGPPALIHLWGANHALNFVRLKLETHSHLLGSNG